MKEHTASNRYGSMAFLFSMLLFLVFILCSVFTILIGSRVYTNIRARNDAAFYSDTALSYISNKVRQADRFGSVAVEKMENHDVLVLTSDYDGILYETWIYTKDGSLLELFSEKGSGLTIDDGLPIMDCGPIAFALSEEKSRPILTIALEEDGAAAQAAPEEEPDAAAHPSSPGAKQAFLSLRSSRKGGPES